MKISIKNRQKGPQTFRLFLPDDFQMFSKLHKSSREIYQTTLKTELIIIIISQSFQPDNLCTDVVLGLYLCKLTLAGGHGGSFCPIYQF